MRFLVLIFTVFSSHFAFAGTETHGGDTVRAEFMDLSHELVQGLQQVPEQWLPDITLAAKISDAVNSVKLDVQEKVYHNEREVQAKNIRSDDELKIVVSRSLWKYAADNKAHYLRLVLHEYLPLVGFVDDDYRTSARILELLSLVNREAVNFELIQTAFQSEDMSRKVLQWMRRSPRLKVQNADQLVLDIVLFAREVSHIHRWEVNLSDITLLILRKTTRSERVNNLKFECAVAFADAYKLAWFYWVENDLRDLYPRAQCRIPDIQ